MTKEQQTAEQILISAGFTFSRVREGSPNIRVYSHSSDTQEVWVGKRGEWQKWTGLPQKMKTVMAEGGKLWTMEGHFEHYKQGVC